MAGPLAVWGYSKVSYTPSQIFSNRLEVLENGRPVLESYDWLEIYKPNDYQQLTQLLDSEFAPKTISEQLQSQITSEVKFVLIEYDYIDKDYRSTFYNFYAKKGRHYRDNCVRLHFFDRCVKFDKELTDLTCRDGQVKDHYYGYIVLRPTLVATLGRSILSPRIRVGARGKVIQSRHRVHLLGYTLSVWGFPSMAQHTDIAVCAHVSCWAILRHYSERFSQHREFLVHDITKLATPFDPGGLTPSLGLHIFEAERIFQAAGCFPIIVAKQPGNELQFYAQLLAYLESGFPLFVAMEDREHAVVIAGYAWRSAFAELTHANSHVWSQVETLLAVDDNLLPYGCVSLEKAAGTKTKDVTYTAEDFDAFIVPLPEKIYYPAHAIESFSLQALYSTHKDILGLPDENDLLRRYFITTISALRRYARDNQSQMGTELVNLLMRLKTAQFIWVVEFASVSQWARGHIAGRAIVDATASPHDKQPVWLSHNDQKAIVFDRSSADANAEVVDLKRLPNTPLGRIEQNLRPVRA